MSFENKFSRLMRNTGPARILIPIGIALLIFGIILVIFNSGDYIETTGTVLEDSVETGTDDNGQKQYTVKFEYEANGQKYSNGEFANIDKQYKKNDTIKVFYDAKDPTKITNTKSGKILPIALIAGGVIAIGLGVYLTMKAFKKSKQTDIEAPAATKAAKEELEQIKSAEGVTEYYFRWDGNSLRPGYLIEDADRKPLFEGKMLKNALIGAREFQFTDHTTGTVTDHQVGHTMTTEYNEELFSNKSGFKIDGKNVWDLLHERGLRIETSLFSKFPYAKYDVTKGGEAYARIESSSVYVHEDEEAQHKLVVPTGRMYYRFWTADNDFESLFLIMFALSDSEQTVAE